MDDVFIGGGDGGFLLTAAAAAPIVAIGCMLDWLLVGGLVVEDLLTMAMAEVHSSSMRPSLKAMRRSAMVDWMLSSFLLQEEVDEGGEAQGGGRSTKKGQDCRRALVMCVLRRWHGVETCLDGGEGGCITMLEEVEPSMAEVWRLDW
eukprot:CAMPEP_0201738684 /NCGR_PEP_ID=MMETSP0593-20130828/45383_1 /ASSEMBLY_ACC=CAM_ASM_000672 /TAXON_ID=267983 /ORGANISM="Skeletonema japonicum, Strain CCMP2506" /LENGTH=146 /DNA_ID=CAMNT_0048232911 /DNA_START=447 /DNA_END=886 /DNA_ORIENTATION=+